MHSINLPPSRNGLQIKSAALVPNVRSRERGHFHVCVYQRGLVSEKELSNVESKLYLKPPWNGLRTKGPHFVLKTREYTKG